MAGAIKARIINIGINAAAAWHKRNRGGASMQNMAASNGNQYRHKRRHRGGIGGGGVASK
jgi:hypothetical protein